MVPNERGWLKIQSLCDWEAFRTGQVTFIICPYQLMEKSEVWCLSETLDMAGWEANNEAIRRGFTAPGCLKPRALTPQRTVSVERQPGAFVAVE